MKNIIEYKGYLGSVEFSNDDEVFFGKLLGIKALVSYEGETAKEIKQAFYDAVEDYLETCKTLEKKPEKPFKGSFNVRINADLHRQAYVLAEENLISLNQFVAEAIKEKIDRQNYA